MKALKIVLVALLVYAGIVVAFESLIGYFQPESESTLIITTFDEEGTAHERVVSRLDVDQRIYVAANHWPRAWYRRVLAHPEVHIALADSEGDYRAVPVRGAEHERVDSEHAIPFAFRVLTGFPPRYFVRLDPRDPLAR